MLVGFVCTVWLPAGLILLAVVVLLIPDLWLSFRVVKVYGVAKNKVSAETVSGIVEYIDGIQMFRAYNMGGVKNRTVTQAMRSSAGCATSTKPRASPIGFGYNIISWGSVPLIMVLAAGPWAAGTLNGVDYLMLSMLPILLTKLTASIAIDLFEWKHLMVSKRNIENLIQEPEETGEDAPFVPERHDITFRDVSFSYIPGEPVLKRVSFTVPEGKLTAIVGGLRLGQIHDFESDCQIL